MPDDFAHLEEEVRARLGLARAVVPSSSASPLRAPRLGLARARDPLSLTLGFAFMLLCAFTDVVYAVLVESPLGTFATPLSPLHDKKWWLAQKRPTRWRMRTPRTWARSLRARRRALWADQGRFCGWGNKSWR